MSLFKLENVEKIYPDGTLALQDVSFTISDGEFVAVMGPSGSGKSTLLHIMGFLDKQSKGTYCFDGKTIDDYTRTEVAGVRNRKMGFIFQTFNLLPRMSVLENVLLPLQYSHTPESTWRSRAEKAVAQVGLTHRINHEPAKLSGGERQRVAAARALVNNPQVIFADEPTGNLDSKSGRAIMDILSTLHEDGHTVVLITHDALLAQYAKRIIHVFDGAIIRDEKVTARAAKNM